MSGISLLLSFIRAAKDIPTPSSLIPHRAPNCLRWEYLEDGRPLLEAVGALALSVSQYPSTVTTIACTAGGLYF